MRILFDQGTPVPLRKYLSGHIVRTAYQQGWSSFLNGGYCDALFRSARIDLNMSYPIKTCVVCGEEFELKPGKPGFANRCPSCSEEDAANPAEEADGWKNDKQANTARREAMRNLLYRKDG